MSDLNKINSELSELGFTPQIVHFPEFGSGEAVVIGYPVTTGRYKGQTFKIGISFQEGGYPEYPPHFLHVQTLPASLFPEYSRHRYAHSDWSVFSVPPSDFWDNLPLEKKNMKTYLNRHLTRFWNQI